MTEETQTAVQVKAFEGIYKVTMPILLNSGYTPAATSHLMWLLINGYVSFDSLHDTVSGIAYAGNKEAKFKILPFSEELKKVNSETVLCSGSVQLDQEAYLGIPAKEYKRREMLLDKTLTPRQVMQPHPGWLELAGQDVELLGNYADNVFKQVYDKFKLGEAMGFYIKEPQEVSILQAWRFSSRDLHCNAYSFPVDRIPGRLIGGIKSGSTAQNADSILEAKITVADALDIARAYLGRDSLERYEGDLIKRARELGLDQF